MQLLQNFPLCTRQLEKLKAAGFETVDDLRDVTVSELSNEMFVPNAEALEILDTVFGVVNSSQAALGQSALELLKAEQLQTSIITFSAKVDEMLGGGISMGKITEICGAPGIGKTQFSMQLAVDVSIPEVFGGVGGEAIFIDTEGSFIIERVAEIAEAAVRHIDNVVKTVDERENACMLPKISNLPSVACDLVVNKSFDRPKQAVYFNRAVGKDHLVEVAKKFSVEAVLQGIHYFRCHDYIELVALVNLLPKILTQKPKVRLVVIDSIACPFRHGFEDMGMRNRVLGRITQNLILLATTRNAAVVLTNQMTTKPHPQDHTSAQLVPALGESWGHACTVRMILFWQQSQRCAMLYKSPSRKQTVTSFQVIEDGVRDLCEDGPELSQDTKALREFVSLSSSQLEDMENSTGDGCEALEDEVLGKDGEEEGRAFCTGSEHAQFLRNISDQIDDEVLPLPTAKENNEAGSSRKREHPGF